MTTTKATRTSLIAPLLVLAALSMLGYHALGNGATNKSNDWPYDDALVPPTGGAVALPGNEVIVSVAPGVVVEPMRVRIEKVKPEDAPGPITEGVTVIKGVRISLPGYDYTQPYAGNFKGRPLEVRFKAEGFVEEPNLFGDYYTAVCFWDDYMGRGTFGVLSWACRYGAESKIVELEGERYYVYWLDVIPERGRYLYLVQYPKALSRQNCEAIGGEFIGNDGVPICSFDYQSPFTAEESMGTWIKGSTPEQSTQRVRTLGNGDSLRVVSANLGDRKLYEVFCGLNGCYPAIMPNDHYLKFDPRDPNKRKYLWEDLLKNKSAHIYMFQEMMVESYYCRSEKIDAPNQHFCNGREPRTNYMEEALRAAFGANWRDHWDYVCKAYECIVVNTDVVQFINKNSPSYTHYFSFRLENERVVMGDENDEDSGILFAAVKIKGKNDTWRETILLNDHLKTPFKRPIIDHSNGSELRKAALEFQNLLYYANRNSRDIHTRGHRDNSVSALGSGLPPRPFIKCGDMNIDYDTTIYNTSEDAHTLLTSLAFACPPDAQPIFVSGSSSVRSPYMFVGRNRYESAAGVLRGRMFDVCATTGEYTGTSDLASHSGTQWDGIGVDHNAVLSVLNHYEDIDTVDVTIKLCPKLKEKYGFAHVPVLNVPTYARAYDPNHYHVFDGPLNLPTQQDRDGNLHIQIPKTLYEQGFLLNKVNSDTAPGLLPEGKYKCSAVTSKCCLTDNPLTLAQPYLPIVPGQDEYVLCF